MVKLIKSKIAKPRVERVLLHSYFDEATQQWVPDKRVEKFRHPTGLELMRLQEGK